MPVYYLIFLCYMGKFPISATCALLPYQPICIVYGYVQRYYHSAFFLNQMDFGRLCASKPRGPMSQYVS